MTDFFDRVLARAGCPPPEADVVRARPRRPEPFEGAPGGGRLPVLDEFTPASPAGASFGRPGPADAHPAPPGSSSVNHNLPGLLPPTNLPGLTASPVSAPQELFHPPSDDRATTGPDRVGRPARDREIHELRTETHTQETTSVVDRSIVLSPEPISPPRFAVPAGSRPDPAANETTERSLGRRERQRRPERVVEVRIGRIEVQAPASGDREPEARKRPARAEPRVSLDDYLSRAGADRPDRSPG